MIYHVIEEDTLQVVHKTTVEEDAHEVAKRLTLENERRYVVWSGV